MKLLILLLPFIISCSTTQTNCKLDGEYIVIPKQEITPVTSIPEGDCIEFKQAWICKEGTLKD